MNKILSSAELEAMSVTDRLQLMDDICASLDVERDRLPMPEWHKSELDRRISAHAADPSATRSWEEVEASILARLRK